MAAARRAARDERRTAGPRRHRFHHDMIRTRRTRTLRTPARSRTCGNPGPIGHHREARILRRRRRRRARLCAASAQLFGATSAKLLTCLRRRVSPFRGRAGCCCSTFARSPPARRERRRGGGGGGARPAAIAAMLASSCAAHIDLSPRSTAQRPATRCAVLRSSPVRCGRGIARLELLQTTSSSVAAGSAAPESNVRNGSSITTDRGTACDCPP